MTDLFIYLFIIIIIIIIVILIVIDLVPICRYYFYFLSFMDWSKV